MIGRWCWSWDVTVVGSTNLVARQIVWLIFELLWPIVWFLRSFVGAPCLWPDFDRFVRLCNDQEVAESFKANGQISHWYMLRRISSWKCSENLGAPKVNFIYQKSFWLKSTSRKFGSMKLSDTKTLISILGTKRTVKSTFQYSLSAVFYLIYGTHGRLRKLV